MDTGILIAIILGAAQVVGSLIIAVSTVHSNNTSSLKDDIIRLKSRYEKLERTKERYAKQLLFLRIVEESVYEELAKANTSYKKAKIKGLVHHSVTEQSGIFYESIDSEIKREAGIAFGEIKPVDIDSYIK